MRAINSSGYEGTLVVGLSPNPASIYRKRVHAANRRQTTGPLRKLLDIRFLEWRTVGETLWARKRRNPQKRNLSISIGVRLAAARSLSFVYRCVTLSAVRSRYHCYLASRRNWIVVLFIGPDARDEHILLSHVILKQRRSISGVARIVRRIVDRLAFFEFLSLFFFIFIRFLITLL